MANAKNVYWDSCVWLAFINEERGRYHRCKYVLEEARAGKIKIWTSALTLAEVFKKQCGVPGDKHVTMPVDRDDIFENYIEQDFVELVQVDREIGVMARRLLRQYPGVINKPPDGIHLATALINNIDELHTFDEKDLIPVSGGIPRSDRVALTICFPPEPPAPTETLPPQPPLIEYDDDNELEDHTGEQSPPRDAYKSADVPQAGQGG